MAFIDLMKAKAKQDKQTIVLPESKDKRTLIAAAKVLEEGTADQGQENTDRSSTGSERGNRRHHHGW